MTTSTLTSQQATVSNTAQDLTDFGFTTAQIAGCRRMFITGTGAHLRYFFSGETPTASFGHIFQDGVTYEQDASLGNVNIPKLSIIREASTDVEVTITLDTNV